MRKYLRSAKKYLIETIYNSYENDHSRSLVRQYVLCDYRRVNVTKSEIEVIYSKKSYLGECDDNIYRDKKGSLFIRDFAFVFKKSIIIQKNIILLPLTFPNLVLFKVKKARDIENVLWQMIGFLRPILNKDCTKKIFDMILV